jgi:hypothetical protein
MKVLASGVDRFVSSLYHRSHRAYKRDGICYAPLQPENGYKPKCGCKESLVKKALRKQGFFFIQQFMTGLLIEHHSCETSLFFQYFCCLLKTICSPEHSSDRSFANSGREAPEVLIESERARDKDSFDLTI